MTGFDFPSESWMRLLKESSTRSSSLHRQFLGMRTRSLAGVKSLIELQIRSSSGAGVNPDPAAARSAVFSSEQLDAFGTGKISDCLGKAFTQYDSVRIPRIPNGELKMMSRIVAISGVYRDFSVPAELTAEYDIPASAWYLRDNASGLIPVSVLMEIALQPCGFLSAYLDSYAFVQALRDEVFYFRNLDGSMHLVGPLPGAGNTISTRARLISSVVSGGTVIQKLGYQISCHGTIFCEGDAVFGYFSREKMAAQVGLDTGKATISWLRQQPDHHGAWLDPAQLSKVNPMRPGDRLSSGWMNFIESAFIEANGGRFGRGYVYAARSLDPHDWFYPYHFYQDPVMPGSLGVEAIYQAIQVFTIGCGLAKDLRSPRFTLPVDPAPVSWRYRGQIVPENQQMELEVHIQDIVNQPGALNVRGDASLWVDGLRIYEVKNAVLQLQEN